LVDGQLQGDSLQLTPHVSTTANETDDALTSTIIPPFVFIDRTLQLGLQWTMTTTVQRVAPDSGAISLAFTLLPDEAVTTEGMTVRDNQVLLSLAANQSSATWESTLPITSTLSWQAPDNTLWVERWHVQPSYVWHVNMTGISPLYDIDTPLQPFSQGASLQWLQWNWQPWPKQAIDLQFTKPIGVAGDTMTVDKVDWRVTAGKRESAVQLDLVLRSSLGDKQIIGLPDNARVTRVTANGMVQPIIQQDNQLFLTVPPGVTQMSIAWQETNKLGWLFSPSQISVDKTLNNISTQVSLPTDRWILALGGPLMGPAVLFWPVAGILLMMAYGLGQLSFSPLKMRHWVLLGLGTSAASPFSMLVIAAWLYALRWRAQQGAHLSLVLFRLVQLGLIVLTVIALSMLIQAIAQGLLGAPDMMINGNMGLMSSGQDLSWYQDKLQNGHSTIWIFSLPIWVYQVLMLLWALWLAFALVRWLRWGWECFSEQGLWRK